MNDTVSMKSHQDAIESLEKEISELQKDINELRETIENLEYDLKKKDEKSLLKDKQLEAKDRLIKHLEEKLEAEDDEQLQYTQTLLDKIENLTNLVKEYRITVGVLIVVILFQIMLMVTL